LGLFNYPDFPKRALTEERFYNQAKAMEAEAGGYSQAARLRLADIADTTDERQRIAAQTNADAWQAESATREFDSTRPRLSAFARAMSAAKARTKIAAMGDQAVESQAVRDRILAAKTGMGIRTGSVRDLWTATQGYDNVSAARMQADQMTSSAWAGAFGTAAGALARSAADPQFRAGAQNMFSRMRRG
jgi:hypothetical protein